MTLHSREELATGAGVESGYLDRLVELGILVPDGEGRFSPGAVRRVLMARSLEGAGIELEGVALAIRRGELSFDFMDATSYDRFAALSPETFQQVSERTGIPLELLMCVREATGSAQPSPEDRMREDELTVLPFMEVQIAAGFRTITIERLLRVQGDSMRRIAEQEASGWRSDIIGPRIAAAESVDDIASSDLADRLSSVADEAVLAIYHAQQAHAWTSNIVDSFESLLAKTGLRSNLARPPAICFLDISGYTRLTQERGDDAAADLAADLARLVQRSSVKHGGKAIKWLGDGVMFHFRDPGPGVEAALEMVRGLQAAGLPPAHVGLHAGPVLFQGGDYYGQTVNIAARIADYARPGEVLVSEAVADAARETGIDFQGIGPVELKGVSATIQLLRATRD